MVSGVTIESKADVIMAQTLVLLMGFVVLLGGCALQTRLPASQELLRLAPSSMPFMPGIVSTEANEYNLSLSDNGELMVFARSEANFERSRIMVMSRTRSREWSPPALIAFGDLRYNDTDPWLTPDGEWLYFSSDRPAAARSAERRDRDIWRVRRFGAGGWGTPEHLAAVSSEAEELGPELIGDTLYFNSSRPGGSGELDIYSSTVRPDGAVTAPTPLPEPINSRASEGDFTLSRDGRNAFFWSTRSGRGLIYTSRKLDGGWSAPEPLPPPVNDDGFNFTPALSADGAVLIYSSTRRRDGQRNGMADIYVAALR